MLLIDPNLRNEKLLICVTVESEKENIKVRLMKQILMVGGATKYLRFNQAKIFESVRTLKRLILRLGNIKVNKERVH